MNWKNRAKTVLYYIVQEISIMKSYVLTFYPSLNISKQIVFCKKI